MPSSPTVMIDEDEDDGRRLTEFWSGLLASQDSVTTDTIVGHSDCGDEPVSEGEGAESCELSNFWLSFLRDGDGDCGGLAAEEQQLEDLVAVVENDEAGGVQQAFSEEVEEQEPEAARPTLRRSRRLAKKARVDYRETTTRRRQRPFLPRKAKNNLVCYKE